MFHFVFSKSVNSKIYFIASTYESGIYTRKQKNIDFMLSVALEKPTGKILFDRQNKKTEKKEFLFQNL